MANSVMQSFLNAQSNAIGILMQKKQLEENKRRFDLNLAAQKAAKDEELKKEAMKIMAEEQKAKIKFMQEAHKDAAQSGDMDATMVTGDNLRMSGGLSPYAKDVPGPSQPGSLPPVQYLTNKKPDLPNSPAAALARLNADNPAKLTELFNAMYSKSGMRLEVGPDGQISFAQGPNIEGLQLNKTQRGGVQEKAINANEGLKRIEGIVQSFRPEFLQIPSRIGAEWTSIKEKLNMGNVKEEDQKFLEDYSIFKQNSLENINLYIKEITGAQMSEKEADRIRKAMPDPGEGVIGGDSPTEFKSKTINTYRKLKAANARYNYYLRMGVPAAKVSEMVNSGAAMPFDAIEKIMEDRASELQKENPGATMRQIASMVAKEFGL